MSKKLEKFETVESEGEAERDQNGNVGDEAALSDWAEDEDDPEDEPDEEGEGALQYMQNRELSWLTFDERVLDQGADESVPLLERLNFISIFWSNLQEFFMVRVGSLTDLSFIEPPVVDSKTGMTPKDQIRAIHERCHELYPIQESTYEHVRGQLAKQGVRHLRPDDLSDEQRNYLFGLVRHNIEPFLSPQIINSRHPFPHLENGKLYILVRLDDEASEAERKKRKKKKGKDKAKKNSGAEGVVLGLIPLPHQCERVIKLPGRGFQFILLEHAIEMFVPEIFSMYKIKHTNVICVTRNADIDANQGFDEQDEDYREHMKRLLKQRARLAPVRLECERPLSPVMEKVMLKKLGLKRFQMYDTIVPLDLSFTWGLGSRLSDKKREKLSNPPFTPAWPTCFDRTRRIIDQVSEHDVLLSYPYESMDPFVQLLREAANDPDVISIKITLYRLASQSHLAEALIAAADAGKEVVALFELRARFDENNNIEWSQRFEQAGCNVLYGFRDYKVHSKICCITRRTPDGGIQHITQLGTGNYNEKTAKLYTDFSFITVDEAFGRDAVEFFRNMQLENVSDNYEVLRVAPLQIKTALMENLDKQIALAQAGRPAYAFMKANSVTDKDIIEKISEASNAGVRITLFIRGICCLVPRVKGATENVRVVSIVGRLLEHSRIYCFGTEDDCTIYLSSADLMTRNLNKRVEIAWPLPSGEIRDKVLSYIDVCMRDTAKLRELRPNATYTPLGAFCDLDEDGNPEPPFDAQVALIRHAADEAAGLVSGANETGHALLREPTGIDVETAPDSSTASDRNTTTTGQEQATEKIVLSELAAGASPESEQDPLAGLDVEGDLLKALSAAAPAEASEEFAAQEAALDGDTERGPQEDESEEGKASLTELTIDEILSPAAAPPSSNDGPAEEEPAFSTDQDYVSEPGTEPATDANPEPQREIEAETDQVPETEPESEPEPAAESKPGLEPKRPAEDGLESEADHAPMPEFEGEADAEPLTDSASESEIEEATRSDGEPGIVSGQSIATEAAEPLEPNAEEQNARDAAEVRPSGPDAVLPSIAFDDFDITPMPEPERADAGEAFVDDAAQGSSARVSELIAQLSAVQKQDVSLKETALQPEIEQALETFEAQNSPDVTEGGPNAFALGTPPLDDSQASSPSAENGDRDGEGALAPERHDDDEELRGDNEDAPLTETLIQDILADCAPSEKSEDALAESFKAASRDEASSSNNPAVETHANNKDNGEFLDGPHRDIEMPPEKKQGFLSRLFGN